MKHNLKDRGRFALGLGIEYTLSKTVLGKSAVISENQTATSDGERGMLRLRMESLHDEFS